MYSSGANLAYGKNNMWSSSSIGVTEALIRNAVNLNNNGDDLFDVVDDKIVPNADLPIQASNFKITSSDEDIVADNSNACSVGVVRDFIDDIDTKLLENYMTETECDSKYLTKNNWSGSYTDPLTAGYSKAEVDSTFATQSTVNTINNNLTNNYYDKTQVDDKLANIDLSDYATKEWVEAAISSGGDIGPIIATESGTFETLTDETYVDLNASPTISTSMHLYDAYNRNHYNEGFKSSYFLKSAKFTVKGYNTATGEYDQPVSDEGFRKELLFYGRAVKSVPDEVEEGEQQTQHIEYEDLDLLVLFDDGDDSTWKYYLKGLVQTSNDPDGYYIEFQVKRNPNAVTHLLTHDKLRFKWIFDGDEIVNNWVRIIKEINNDGFVTESHLNEVETNIANTYLTKLNAQTTYATKTYVDDSISGIPDAGMKTIVHPIEAQTLTITSGQVDLIELDESETINTIQFDIECTITSNGTDITHNLDNYSFQIKDNSNQTLCTLNSIYQTSDTKLSGSYSGQITSSNKQLSLYVETPTIEETIVLTASNSSLGTITQIISGYISKTYADEHYASKDTPTVVNINNYDESSHTTNKTTYDLGPDFTIKFDSLIGITVKMKSKKPVVQMATAAITTILQFGLDKLTSGSLTASNDAYESDIYNVIGTSQLAALTDFATWVSSYSRYSGTTLNNFLITAAAAEQRYLKSTDMTNYYTKTDADARFINVDEPVELLKRNEVIPITATIPTSTLTCTSTSFSSSYQIINSSYAIESSGTKHLVSSVSVSVSSGNISDLKLQLYLASGSTYAYTYNSDGTFSIDGNKQIYKSNGEVRLRYAKTSSSATDIEFQITAISISYDYTTTITEYYSKTKTDSLLANNTNWNWTNSSTPYAFGVNSNYIQMTENNSVVNRIAPGGIYTEVISPESMIQFGKLITGGNDSSKWLSSIVGVANDNYNPTTYSSVSTDSIVPSVKYVSNNMLVVSVNPTITATFPSATLTASNSVVKNITVGTNLIPISTNTKANCSVSVSVSSGELSTLRVGLVLAPSSGTNLTQMLTNNGDGTFTLSNYSFSTDTTKTYSVRLDYQRLGGSANVSFTFDSCDLSFTSPTSFDNYYPKSYVDALEARIAALENAN